VRQWKKRYSFHLCREIEWNKINCHMWVWSAFRLSSVSTTVLLVQIKIYQLWIETHISRVLCNAYKKFFRYQLPVDNHHLEVLSCVSLYYLNKSCVLREYLLLSKRNMHSVWHLCSWFFFEEAFRMKHLKRIELFWKIL